MLGGRVRVVDVRLDLRVAAGADLVLRDADAPGAGLARLIDRIPGTVALLVDTPRSEFDVPACLAKHRNAIERCTTTRTRPPSMRTA